MGARGTHLRAEHGAEGTEALLSVCATTMALGAVKIIALRAYALTLPPIGFALRSVQTHISMRNCFEMCVCALLKANPIGGRVRAYALKGKKTASL